MALAQVAETEEGLQVVDYWSGCDQFLVELLLLDMALIDKQADF